MERKTKVRIVAGVVFWVVSMAGFFGWLTWTLYLAPNSSGPDRPGTTDWVTTSAYWTIMLSLPLLILAALLSGIWGSIRVRKLRRRFPDALVLQSSLPFNSSLFLGVLLPSFIPRLTMGCTLVAREEALEIWWGLFARRCGRLRWGDIDSITEGETVAPGHSPNVLHWMRVSSPTLPADLKVAIIDSVWLAHPTAGKAMVEEAVGALNAIREGKKVRMDLNVSNNQAFLIRKQLRVRVLRNSIIWGFIILVVFSRWANLVLEEQKIAALVSWVVLLSLASGFCAQGLCAMVREKLLKRMNHEQVVISMLAPNMGFRLPGKIFPFAYNRAIFGVNLTFDTQGISFWQGILVRRYGKVNWDQVDSVSVLSGPPNLFGPQAIPTLVIRSSVWGGVLTLPVMVAPWTFSSFATEGNLTEIIEQIESLRRE